MQSNRELIQYFPIRDKMENSQSDTKSSRREFADMSDAFSYCRSCDRPVIAIVKGVPYKLFPSGKAVDLTACAKTQYESMLIR